MPPTLSPFSNEWITFVVFLLGIFGLIGLSEFVRGRLEWRIESSRKLVHVLVGMFIMTSHYLFSNNSLPILLAIIFIIVNVIALRSKLFKGLHETERKSFGTIYFPIAFLLLCIFWWERQITFKVAILILTFADTAAAIVGENLRNPKAFQYWRDKKTVQGSLTMAIMSALLTGFGTVLFRKLSGLEPFELPVLLMLSFLVATMATIAEMLSDSGSDNFSVPIISAITYDLSTFSVQNQQIMTLLIWTLASFILIQIAFKLRVLSIDGALGAFIMGIFVFGIGGWKFVIPMGVFFALSSSLSKINNEKKIKHSQPLGKIYTRDVLQVFSNGGIPMLLTIWWFYNPLEILYVAYLGSVAAATADTWATEIGSYAKAMPRNCLTLQQMEPGASGGVTPIGTIGALLAAWIIALSGQFFLLDSTGLSMVVLAGFTASIFDSILGATVQAKYTCRECDKKIELAQHCDRSSTLISGSRIINNDMVNLLCTISGGTIILLLS